MYEGGPAGLVRAFMMAGAQNIVAYRGLVSDTTDTVAFVRAFYSDWVRSREVDTALREAQIEMCQTGKDQSFWASYTVIRQRTG